MEKAKKTKEYVIQMIEFERELAERHGRKAEVMYIVTKDGDYTYATGLEELEYAEKNGWSLVK